MKLALSKTTFEMRLRSGCLAELHQLDSRMPSEWLRSRAAEIYSALCQIDGTTLSPDSIAALSGSNKAETFHALICLVADSFICLFLDGQPVEPEKASNLLLDAGIELFKTGSGEGFLVVPAWLMALLVAAGRGEHVVCEASAAN